LFISASRNIGLDKLRRSLMEVIQSNFVEESVSFDNGDGQMYSMVHYLAEVLSIRHSARKTTLRYRCRQEDAEKIRQASMKRKDFAKVK
ncbi:MAG: hypothetical protein KDC45_13865, partial [Bacteroidetes bacterium]|nr:hypothetical protein [Bacteroidota bacterium]